MKRPSVIKVEDLSFGFAQKDLYDHICFEIEKGDHAVLIGSNGTGKSTLIDMLLHPENYLYDGKIEREEMGEVGLITQFVRNEGACVTAYDYLAEPIVALLAEADALCGEMAEAEDMEEVCRRYQTCLDRIDAVDGYNYDSNIRRMLENAGLSGIADLSTAVISGGEYKMLSIIRSMLRKPQLLIMDEPDVFLDFENLVGLTRLINSYEGTVLAITHNRLLLNRCFDKVLHLENMELQEFPGSYAQYTRAMLETKIAMHEQSVKDAEWIEIQEKLVERLRDNATDVADPRLGRQLKARVSYLERLQARKTRNPFIEDVTHELRFPEIEEERTIPDIGFEDYSLAFDQPLISNASFRIGGGEKVALVGANGTGKSSMLNDLYGRLEKDSAFGGEIAIFKQIYDDDAQTLSGGERNIAQLKKIMQSNASVLFLDEPTSHLDTVAQRELEDALEAYRGTVLMVSHDFFTIMNCADRVLMLENGAIREMSGRAYRKSVYKQFFGSDIFAAERKRKEDEHRINDLLKAGKAKEARKVWEAMEQ
ncbi:MAG: ATP-binding cassette domain-containing protein [Oscillospiraceae bacterium]|nr:ATP-binding cassette domain-containing protein [Oscillospiraceae bacterium]